MSRSTGNVACRWTSSGGSCWDSSLKTRYVDLTWPYKCQPNEQTHTHTERERERERDLLTITGGHFCGIIFYYTAVPKLKFVNFTTSVWRSILIWLQHHDFDSSALNGAKSRHEPSWGNGKFTVKRLLTTEFIYLVSSFVRKMMCMLRAWRHMTSLMRMMTTELVNVRRRRNEKAGRDRLQRSVM